jgi:hypothetical protein
MALNLHQISAASGGNFAPSTILSFDKSQWLVPFRISAQVTALVPRYANMDALYHFLVLFSLSIAVLLRKRPRPVALLLVIPVLTEILQFVIPGRTFALRDAMYGYLGILAGYCLVQLWREISHTVKKVRLYLKRLALLSQSLMCPLCQGVEIRRVTRKLWMRLIPGSRLYLCRNCNRHFAHYSGRYRTVAGFLALVMLFKVD